MVVIKLQLNNDIRRVNVPGPLSFKDLHELTITLFEGSLPKVYFFKYKDDEGDLITVSSDRELEEAFRIYKAQDILRLIISVPEKQENTQNKNSNTQENSATFFDILEKLVSENGFIRDLLNNLEVEVISSPNSPRPHCSERQVPQAEVVHQAICDGCESQIKGIRYKCTTCPDYDLCQQCLAKNIHPEHEFVEILRPSRRGCPMRRPDFARGPSCPWRRQCGNNNACNRTTNQSEVIHPATCDGCHQRIKGLRYKCNNCIDYDLCQSCKDKNVHSEHTFTTLSKPVFTPPGWKPEPAEKKEETKTIPVSQPAPPKEATTPLMKVEPVVPVKVETPVKSEPVAPKVEPKPEPKVETVAPKPEPVKIETPVPSAPKATPPASPVVPKTPNAGPFEQKLKQLEEMGFTNRAKNIEYLVKRNGDMVFVVKDLLDA